MHEESIRFEAEIAEVGRDPSGVGWDSPDVFALADVDIAEMTAGDTDPVFAELLVLREGIGTGRPGPKRYTAKAVEDCARLLPGVLGYLGHQRHGDREHEYRTPQLRILKGRVDTVVEDGRPIKVARAKGYVSRRAQDLRTHLREGMAGPVSIDGRAILEKRDDESVVVEITGLRSVDFCNPGTAGVEGAGVVAVVSEMGGTKGMANDKSGRLSRDELLAGYGAEVEKIVQESSAQKEAEIARLNGELATRSRDFQETTGKLAEIRARESARELRDHAARLVAGLEGVSEEIREIVSKRIDSKPLDGDPDLSKSKAALKESVDRVLAEVREIVERTGGTLQKKGGAPGPVAGGNPPRREPNQKGTLARAILARGADLYPEAT